MDPLTIVVAHTYYRQSGGEDRVFHDERDILQAAGHDVRSFTANNADLNERSPVSLAAQAVWNRDRADALRHLIRRSGAQVVHFHNTFPSMSPAVLRAAHEEGAAVVQTLHNYRLFCPAGTFLRAGRVCTDCTLARWPWPAVAHRCYRNNRGATLTTAAMLTTHRLIGTWRKSVDAYITLSDHGRGLFERLGLPAEKLHTKPNFLASDPGPGPGGGGFGLFVGRLSEEKGIRILIEAAKRLNGEVPLRVVGEGPLESVVRAASNVVPGLEWLGARTNEDVLDLMGRAAFLIVPSIWEEPFGRTVVESYARGTPVLAAAAGALPSLVRDGVTGMLFAPGDVDGLAACIRRMGGDESLATGMRARARAEFTARYTAPTNLRRLLEIYGKALAIRNGRASPAKPEELAWTAPG